MSQWTESARQAFERYCARTRQSLAGTGADAEEVIDDLRRHVDEEIRSAGLTVATEEDMERILRRVGEAAAPVETPSHSAPASSVSNPETLPERRRPGWTLLIMGVILPAIALGLELVTGVSAGVLFDPLPTWFQVLAVSLVPLANLWMWRAGRAREAKDASLLGWLNGLALGVCIYYSILYLPFAPFAAFGVIYFGLGLIPLSPYFALTATPLIRRAFRNQIGVGKLPGTRLGPILAIGFLLAMQLPMALTYYGLARAASDNPAINRAGVRLLRTFGNHEIMLRACYGMLQRPLDVDLARRLASAGHVTTAEEARKAYYQVTGQPFNSVPPPTFYTRAGRWSPLQDELTWDDALGGESVAGRVKGLSLESSRLDAKVEPDAAIVYCEWTFEFHNSARQQREARAQIALPPGGVVSRLTLWVNGEEREAAFGGRSQVRQAYQQVAVVRRRDPVLVTTCGPDRVLMQCFPVPANGGTMKVRIGITAPVMLDSLDQGHFVWPNFLERNFAIGTELKHALWIESPMPVTASGDALQADHPKENTFALHGSLSARDFAETTEAVVVKRSADVLSIWTPSLDSDSIIRQTTREVTPKVPSRVVIVIDGSAGMKERAEQVADALDKLPDTAEVAVLIAGDEVVPLTDKPQKVSPELRKTLRAGVRSFHYIGGRDNLPALDRAWDLAAGSEPGLVVWIHAPQPFMLSSADPLRQRMERSSQSVRLVGMQIERGPNRIAEKLDGLADVSFYPRLGSLESDLTRLISLWDGKSRRFELVRELVPQTADAVSGRKASRHLERLWARDEVARLEAKRDRKAAADLAARNQIVTPVTGAVVLENQQQYAENNLKPAEPTTVPAIPEPKTWILLLLGVCIPLLRRLFDARRQRCRV